MLKDKYMSGTGKIDYVQTLPFVAHLQPPSCQKPVFFSYVCLWGSPLHPFPNTYKALNPCLILVQVLNETRANLLFAT